MKDLIEKQPIEQLKEAESREKPDITEEQALKVKDKEIEELKTREEALNKRLDEMEKKIQYAPKPTELPENQKELPKGMHESQIATKVTDIATVIKEKMDQLHDLATMEVMLETFVRAKNRLESIKKMGSAEHIKVRGLWKTVAPKMHISGLMSKKINNDEFEISFGVYDTDEKDNKKIFVHYADVQMQDGSSIRRPTSAEYRIAYEVIERIKSGKPITREVVKIDRVQS